MTDLERLRELMEKYHYAQKNYESAGDKRTIRALLRLEFAAVQALPKLLAVVEAAVLYERKRTEHITWDEWQAVQQVFSDAVREVEK